MEDTPTDPKEAPVIAHTDYKAIASGLQRVNAALESALAAQTERADRLQAEVEEYRRECDASHLAYQFAIGDRDKARAELDAVRKERDRARGYHHHLCQEHLGSGRCTCWIISVGAKHAGEYDTEVRKLQAKCAELEKLIQDAPHEAGCHAGLYVGPRAIRLTCTCWKSRLTPAPPEEKRL